MPVKGVQLWIQWAGGNILVQAVSQEAAMMYELGFTRSKQGYAEEGVLKAVTSSFAVWSAALSAGREATAKYRIMLDVHKPIKETGIRRTWPNMMTREGARGMEWNAWSEGNSGRVSHDAALREDKLSGPMDYTPGIFDIDYSTAKADKDGSEWNGPNAERCIKTTLARQIANCGIIACLCRYPQRPDRELRSGHPAFRFFLRLRRRPRLVEGIAGRDRRLYRRCKTGQRQILLLGQERTRRQGRLCRSSTSLNPE